VSSDAVTYESQDNIAIITINRPDKMNAFNPAVGEGFKAAWQRLNESDDRVGIITGAGDRAFSAGADIGDPAENWSFMPGVGVTMEKPLIAAVNGWCIGIAVVLVQFCDLCVMAEDAKLSYPEAQLGFCGGLIASIVARIPHKLAMEMILVGEEMTAERAYEIGFVNKVVPRDELMQATMGYAGRLADNAPLVMALIKNFTGQVIPKGPAELSGIVRTDLDFLAASADQAEGRVAFRDKRKPIFTGR
jgi:enoyl-CoA hydratase/carnithine racemase